MGLEEPPRKKLSPIDEYYQDWHAQLGPPKRMSVRSMLAVGLTSLAITAFCVGVYVYHLWGYIVFFFFAVFAALFGELLS